MRFNHKLSILTVSTACRARYRNARKCKTCQWAKRKRMACITANNKDRVFAIGPEFGVILPTKKFNFLVRVLPEFGARNRAQGVTVVFGLGKRF